jgi:hypothetical protein
MRNHNVKIDVMKRHQITNAIYEAAIATGHAQSALRELLRCQLVMSPPVAL